MAVGYVDMSIRDNCWNLNDSYGEICVHCGCYSKNRVERWQNRIRTLKEWLQRAEEFDGWSDYPECIATQKKNIEANKKYFKRELRYYEKKLAFCRMREGEQT